MPECSDEVSLPLQSVLDALPPELKCCVVPMNITGATLTVALRKVLPQLPQGTVRLAFGDIRQAAPSLFTMGGEADHQEVDLPMNELLVRIHPSLLPQKQGQSAVPDRDAIEDSFNLSATHGSIAAKPAPIRVPLPVMDDEDLFVKSPTPDTACDVETENVPAVSPSATSADGSSMNVPIASFLAGWPNTIRAEIERLDCATAQIALPESLVQEGMKRGQVAFPWKTLRNWIQPAPPSSISKFDDTTLPLPLEVLMPLFLARWKQTPKTQPKLVVDESIPALFAPDAPPEAPSAMAGESAPETADPVAVFGGTDVASQAPDTVFLDRSTSPTELVARATRLDGVAGALVVLPEGLLVASKILPGQDADGLAAFLAQAAGRLSQAANEAHVGDVSRLEFCADNVPWQIIRLQGVLVAAFGSAGGTLPTAELAALAEGLNRMRTP